MVTFPGGYPATRRLDLVEDLLGHQVADPYRWLEDAGSDETRQWLAAQEDLWASQRDALPGREQFAARVRELLGTGSVGLPAWRGTTRFYTRRDPGQEHAVLYVHDGDAERAKLSRQRARQGHHRSLGSRIWSHAHGAGLRARR